MVGLHQFALVNVPDLRGVLSVVGDHVTLVLEHVVVRDPGQALQLVVRLLQVGCTLVLLGGDVDAPLRQVETPERAVIRGGEPEFHVLLIEAKTVDWTLALLEELVVLVADEVGVVDGAVLAACEASLKRRGRTD